MMRFAHVLGAVGAATVASRERNPAIACEAGSQPKTSKRSWKDFDDAMGQVPKPVRISSRIVTGFALVSFGGPAALFALPAYDACKWVFHKSIGRDDKVRADGIGVAVGTLSAGAACGAESIADAAVQQAVEVALKKSTIQACDEALMETAKQVALVKTATVAAVAVSSSHPASAAQAQKGSVVVEACNFIEPGCGKTLVSLLRERGCEVDEVHGDCSYARVRVSLDNEKEIRAVIHEIAAESGKTPSVHQVPGTRM